MMHKFIGLLSICFFLTTCTKDFEEINTNQNAPSEVQPELLLRQVIYGYGDAMSYEGFVAGNLLSQHFAMIDFNLFDRHALNSPQEGGNPWPILYTALRDNETILDLSRSNPANAVYEGPALVMKAYLTMTLTDMFGDVPYAEAFTGRSTGVVTPRYDEQETIYTGAGGILEILETSTRVMDDYRGAQPLSGDIIFGGDLSGWVRFANSLRIKALMRISDRRDPTQDVLNIMGDGRIMQEADQSAVFSFAANPPNDYPLARARIGIFNVFLMSATAAEVYDSQNFLGETLRARQYSPAASDGSYTGIVNGIDASTAITPDNFARPGTIWRENSAEQQFNFMTAWETNYLLAEAALRGFHDGDADQLAEKGTRQMLAFWGADPESCNGTCVTLTGTEDDNRERLANLKWMGLAGNAYEAWAEYRRTGYPTAIRPAAASLNGGVFPVRMPYPSDEQALNFENYRSAAAATQDNSINVPVWWDVD